MSIVIPVLDEAPTIVDRLVDLTELRIRGAEIIVVDGGSSDATVSLSIPLADLVLTAPRGRASQMNAGAAAASGSVLVFLHADTRLPTDADRLITGAIARHSWGRFDIRFDSLRPSFAVVAGFMNERSHLTGIATGDQTVFVRRTLFEQVGGFPSIALMEDIALSALLRRRGRPARVRQKVVTSARRWEQRGVIRTIVLMWRLRLAYFFGADPELLAVRYGYRGVDSCGSEGRSADERGGTGRSATGRSDDYRGVEGRDIQAEGSGR